MIVCEPADLKRRPHTAIAAKFTLLHAGHGAGRSARGFAAFFGAALVRPDVL